MKKLLMAAAAATFALGTAAGAATLSIDGGFAGAIPDTGQNASPENNVLDALGIPAPLGGFFGSSISIDEAATLKVELIGYEAQNTNEFEMNGGTVFSGGGNGGASGAAVLDSQVAVIDVAGGLLDFVFRTIGHVSGVEDGNVANGANPAIAFGPINFFATFGDDSQRAGVSELWLFLDDTGQTGGDNHDDLVIRISVVPLPAGALLLATGLGALALRRRKS